MLKKELPKVCMFVMNPVTSDPRVMREAKTLVDHGYDITIVGLGEDRYTEFSSNGIKIILLKKPFIYRIALKIKKNHVINKTMVQRNHDIKESATYLLNIIRFIKKIIYDIGEISYVLSTNIAMTFVGSKIGADMYHSHDLNTLLTGYLSSKLKRAKLIYDFHEAYAEQFPPGTYTKMWQLFYSFLEKNLIKKSDRLITVCESLRNWAIECYGLSEIAVIMNASTYVKPDILAKNGGEKIVLYHGIYMKDRGLEQLVESAKYFAPETKLILRGKGKVEPILRSIVKNERLEDKVEFVPPVKMEELVKYASEADIGIIPYIATNLNNKFATPNKLFEYMMAGLAIAGSDLPELRNIIIGNNLGKVFDPTDPKDIARAINEMLSDKELLTEMKNNSLKAARDKYNWEKESQKLIALYETLCAE